MSFHLITTMQKPIQHISMSDWNSKTDRLRNVANARRADALALRSSSRLLRDQSHIECDWANYESNNALDARIIEVKTWRNIISKTFDRLLREIHALEAERKAAENELEWQAGPLSVIREMLFVRDDRVKSESTYDRAGIELKNELYVLENNARLLADRIQNAWEKLSRLEVVRFKVESELGNKTETVNIDTTQRALDRNSDSISFKVDPKRAPKNFRSYDNWLTWTHNLKQMAGNETADTAAIRESLFVCREKARSILQAQQERTNHYLRVRIFQTEQAYNELEWQRLRMMDDLKASSCEIQDLEEALNDKTNRIKLAETRLENRKYRCSTEMCLDEVYELLCLEVDKLREIQSCLMNKLNESRANFNLLSNHANKIDEDLAKKQHAIITDKKTLEVRQRVWDDDSGIQTHSPCPQTDRNIELTHSENITAKK
ncbi:tektin-2-like [Drosophila montana]|uniref:tektin-2-like n=1 Tax=Drosophila montana TaxID=40370 RepID=UPI00313AF1BA